MRLASVSDSNPSKRSWTARSHSPRTMKTDCAPPCSGPTMWTSDGRVGLERYVQVEVATGPIPGLPEEPPCRGSSRVPSAIETHPRVAEVRLSPPLAIFTANTGSQRHSITLGRTRGPSLANTRLGVAGNGYLRCQACRRPKALSQPNPSAPARFARASS